jgi:type VI protein secretion system component VasF
MTESRNSADRPPAQIVRELNELIAALDRRVPQVERVGEVALARAAAALRDEARRRIEEIEREAAARGPSI